MVKSCRECATTQKNPAKVPTHQWEETKNNFERVHIDFAGEFLNHHFLVLVDSKSKWAEVRIIKNAPTASITIELLLDIFSTHGFPEIMVSDNATIFHSENFKAFCKNNGIVQKFIAPGHPATNGLAERYIQTLKSKLSRMTEPGTIQSKVREIIFRYRATPLQNGKTPAEQYLNRNIRCQLDAFKPSISKQKKQVTFQLPRSRKFNVGETVLARWYTSNKITWRLGIITKKFGKLHYQVKLENGYCLKRHVNQLKQTKLDMKHSNQPPIAKTAGSLKQEDSNQTGSNKFDLEIVPLLITGNLAGNQPLPGEVEPQEAPEEAADINNRGDNNHVLLRRSRRERRVPTRFKDFQMTQRH